MPEKPKLHPDPIVADLQVIRSLAWSRGEDFTRLKVLFAHPLVTHKANNSDEPAKRVKSLRECLLQTVSEIRKNERSGGSRRRNSVAGAAVPILSLQRKYEAMTLTKRREEIKGLWKNRDGEPMNPEGFRLRYEVPVVFVTVANEFRALARREAEKHGFDLEEGDDEYAAAQTMAGKITARLRKLEETSHAARIEELKADGMLQIRDEEEMLAVLLTVTRTAKCEFKAVDYTPIAQWFDNHNLHQYLKRQLKRVQTSDIDLTRIRVVSDDELTKDEDRKALKRFLKLHEKAGAQVLLCQENAPKRAETNFKPNSGLFLADASTEPVAVRGKLAENSVGEAAVYTHNNAAMRSIRQEYERLLTVIESHGYDDEIRGMLGLKPQEKSG